MRTLIVTAARIKIDHRPMRAVVQPTSERGASTPTALTTGNCPWSVMVAIKQRPLLRRSCVLPGLAARSRAKHVKWRKVGVTLHHPAAQLSNVGFTVKLVHPLMTIGTKSDGILDNVRPTTRKPQNMMTVEKRLTVFFEGCWFLA